MYDTLYSIYTLYIVPGAGQYIIQWYVINTHIRISSAVYDEAT